MTIQVRSNDPVADAAINNPEAKAPESSETKSAPEANASEQNESVNSDATETEAKESESAESEEPKESESHEESHDESESKDQADADKPGKKKGGFQRRIDKLNAKAADAQREAEYWRRVALEKQDIETKTEQVATTQDSKSTDGEPNPDSFDTHAAYVKALAKWEAKQMLAEERRAAEQAKIQSEQSRKVQTYLEKKSAFAEKTPDFDDVIESVDGIVVSPTVSQLIIESDHGPELAYELAKNRKEYERINQLSPLAAAREMGKIEARIALKASEAKQETKKITNAPKPIEPVGGRKGSVKKDLNDPSLSQKEFEQLYKERFNRRRA